MRADALVWVVPAALLIVALLPLPYGYYTALRIVVPVAAGYLAYKEFAMSDSVNVWVIGLAGIAVLFNPIIPIHLSREVWAPIDVATAIVFLAHWKFGLKASDKNK